LRSVHTYRLKLISVGLFLFCTTLYCYQGSTVHGFSAGPPLGRTGAPALGAFPAELTCQGCHSSFPLNSGPGVLTLTGLPDSYTANQEITLSLTITQADRARYGFEATALDDLGRKAGELILTEPDRTQLSSGVGAFVGRQYIEHTAAGFVPSAPNQGSWTFRWRAPAQSVGRVTFYAASNAANGNGNNSGDFIYLTNDSIQSAVALPLVTAVSAASYGGTLAVDSVGAIFGANLAAGPVTATIQPLPTLLGETKVNVLDNLGVQRDAGLFAVTSGQVNFLVPAGTANGLATVTVTRNNAPVGAGNLSIDTIAPALYAANQNGAGVASAVVYRLKATGEQSFEPIANFDQAQARFVATPIDLGPDTDQVFLIFYGSGIRGITALSSAGCTIGGTAADVSFAGAAPGFAGLDQVNVRVPRSLAGRGAANVVLTVAGKAANTVSLMIR
jgi:uncharacterized protein (TIGR03437 family)